MLARFYTLSGDAQATTRCVVPARVLPGQVLNAGMSGVQGGLPSVWQNPVRPHLFSIVQDSELGNRIAIDVDDPYHTAYPGWKQEDLDAHLDALKHADVLICTTEALAEAYSGHHDDIRVIPSCVDVQDFQFGRQYQHLDGKIRVGYAAGYTHGPDAALLAEPLAQIAELPDVIVEFMGAFDPGWDFPYKRYPALPLAAYKSVLATWGVGLAPLTPSELNLTRSDLKILDYGMSFAVPVCSPVGPYKALVEQGLVCSAETPTEWYEVVRDLIEQPSVSTEMAMRIYNYCRIERHPANQRVAYLDALGLSRSYAHA